MKAMALYSRELSFYSFFLNFPSLSIMTSAISIVIFYEAAWTSLAIPLTSTRALIIPHWLRIKSCDRNLTEPISTYNSAKAEPTNKKAQQTDIPLNVDF